MLITVRKSSDLVRYLRRAKRSKEVGESAVAGAQAAEQGQALQQALGREPTPEFAAEVAEECRRLLELLGDGELRSIAVWKMEGWNNSEIAGKLACSRRRVERKLELIRSIWEQAGLGSLRSSGDP